MEAKNENQEDGIPTPPEEFSEDEGEASDGSRDEGCDKILEPAVVISETSSGEIEETDGGVEETLDVRDNSVKPKEERRPSSELKRKKFYTEEEAKDEAPGSSDETQLNLQEPAKKKRAERKKDLA